MIGFNVPPYIGDELQYVKEAMENAGILEVTNHV